MASTTEHAARGSGALLVVGATSGAGKSTLVTALCRAFARRADVAGVAPFKAQNMSTHTVRTADGGLIGVAQAMQARAAGVEPEARMGPILLCPTGSRSSRVIVLGKEVGESDALSYADRARTLRPLALETLTGLRSEHELVVLEGAGGAAEINLLERDLVNLPLAAAAGVPAVLVVDIERGGAFASAYGTWALLPERLRSCLKGFVINTFRGDVRLLDSGLADLEQRTGIPVLGVLPHLGDHLMLGVEDSLDLDRMLAPKVTAGARQPSAPLRVAVLQIPRLADPADLDPLVLEPSVQLRWATHPTDLSPELADLVIVPRSSSPEATETWLHERGLDAALDQARTAGPRVLHLADDAVDLDAVDLDAVDLTDDAARRAYLTRLARESGREYVAGDTAYGDAVEAHLDHLGDWVEAHLDIPRLLQLARTAVRPGQEPGW
ncbi:cobyric acid synthase [Ornithinimicrobium sp. Y1694]|uniref:cobyric acid synthase n=1 Tax=Ornithinimicrobium sp. Y1694 TaxID=3418590 RepID=UPI003CE82BCA